MKTRRRIRKRIKEFYKSLHKGARQISGKDLDELLADDYPDSSDTDAGSDIDDHDLQSLCDDLDSD